MPSGQGLNPILSKIVEAKHLEIHALKDRVFPIRGIPIHSLFDQINSPGLSIIAECKKASPSAGVIRKGYNAIQIAKEYQRLGACAISVLTDASFFQGSIEDLRDVSINVSLPVIRKDFILDEIQIEEAYANGASAILLIVRILEEKRLIELYQFAKKLGMDVLVETHNEIEIQVALDSGFSIVGINTRDLDTFEINDSLVEKLRNLIPKGTLVVAESGISSEVEFKRYLGLVDACLIGTYFMRSDSIESAYKSLFT